MSKKQKATTLIEMIIVMTIFSVIGVAIATSFMTGMKVWGRVNNRDFKYNFIMLEVENIAKEVREHINIEEVSCFGKNREFSFLTFKGDRIIRATYIFDVDNQKLLFTEEPLAGVLSEKESSVAPAREIFKAEDIMFKYFLYDPEKDKYSWADSWDNDKSVLAGVQIRLKFKNDKITKTIFIPQA